jgi:hypothetical protein
MLFVRFALYLVVVLIIASLSYAGWFAMLWGLSPILLAPLYLTGIAIAAGIGFGAYLIGRNPHA